MSFVPLRTAASAVAITTALMLTSCASAPDDAAPQTGSNDSPAESAKPSPADVEIDGSVSYLHSVGFTGGQDPNLRFKPPRAGAPCPPVAGFDDIVPGAALTISTPTGETIDTVGLEKAGAVVMNRKTRQEREKRARFIDSIFDLRIARTWNALEQAQLAQEKAQQRLYDLRHPKSWNFEGARFYAVWCRLPFSATLPASDEQGTDYVFQVANRPSTVVSSDEVTDPRAFEFFLG